MHMESYIDEVKQGVGAMASRFANLTDPSVVTHPIPFFGRVDRVRVLDEHRDKLKERIQAVRRSGQ
jgi:hypothetical protein